MKYSLGISNSLEDISSLSHSIVSLYFFVLITEESFLLAILWNSAFRWVYLSFSPLPFASLLFSAICKASLDKHFAFLNLFFLEMVLIIASCQCHDPLSIVLQALCLSNLIPWIYLTLLLYNYKGFDLGHTWIVYGFPCFLQLKSEFCSKEFWSEPQSATGLVLADCIELLHLQLQRIWSTWFRYWPSGDIHV